MLEISEKNSSELITLGTTELGLSHSINNDVFSI